MCMHAGFIQSLSRARIYPTHISGTSAGAVAGLVYSATESADEFAATVRAMAPEAVQSPSWPSWLPSWCQWGDSIALGKPMNKNDKALAQLALHGPAHWADVKIELRMWSSMVGASGMLRHNVTALDFDTPAEAAMASMSVPYLFPPMIGRDPTTWHYDGGCVFNAPLVPEWITTLDHCFLLVGQTRQADRPAADKPDELTRAIRILKGMMGAQILTAVDALSGHDNCTIIWPDFTDDTGILTFNPDLIDWSAKYATDVLKGS